MAINHHELGPGAFTIGATGSEQQFGTDVRSCSVTPSVQSGDRYKVLSGDESIDTGEETWTVEGSVMQRYDMSSLIAWCAEHSGDELPFKFRANNDEALSVRGKLQVRAIKYGGDVGQKNQSDFKFDVIGTPEFYDASTGA